MACRLTGARPISEPMLDYLVNWTLRNKLHWNLNRNSNIFIQENAFESVVCETAAILSRPQCVNFWPIWMWKSCLVSIVFEILKYLKVSTKVLWIDPIHLSEAQFNHGKVQFNHGKVYRSITKSMEGIFKKFMNYGKVLTKLYSSYQMSTDLS